MPTNLELVEMTPVILIGKVEGGQSMSEDSDVEPSIRVIPVAGLKGDAPTEPFEIEGVGLADDRFAILSNPYELASAHPLAYIGGCVRYMFPLGTNALFFLEKREGKWASAGGAFTRGAEDVPSNDAPWPQLVRIYARASQLPVAERRAFLESERIALVARADDPVARLMAMDIARQFDGANKPWNAQMMEMVGDEEMSAENMAELVEEAAAGAKEAASDAAKPAKPAKHRSKRH